MTTPGFVTSFEIDHCLALQASGTGDTGNVGFLADGAVNGAWMGDHVNAYGHEVAFSPDPCNAFGCWTNASEIDPELGSCMVYIPAGSPMHTLDNEIVGASILYRYEEGVLTDEPLWDPMTGAFPRGAMVDGVNGPGDGETCSNVHERLNVNVNGCVLPYCPADFVEPAGVLDIFDLLAYLGLFQASNARADLNGDTLIDIFDVLAYLDLFQQGCP